MKKLRNEVECVKRNIYSRAIQVTHTKMTVHVDKSSTSTFPPTKSSRIPGMSPSAGCRWECRLCRPNLTLTLDLSWGEVTWANKAMGRHNLTLPVKISAWKRGDRQLNFGHWSKWPQQLQIILYKDFGSGDRIWRSLVQISHWSEFFSVLVWGQFQY